MGIAELNPVCASKGFGSEISDWLERLDPLAVTTSNAGCLEVPFQRWMKFKEAFSPKFVIDAISSLPSRPNLCVDPFGGSGTTALTCSILGIDAVTIEVNPFLHDLIAAKLCRYDLCEVASAIEAVIDRANDISVDISTSLDGAPRTMCEPGLNGRWIFNEDVCARILALRTAFDCLKSPEIRRLFKVLLGGKLVELSNVVINGKGRRYRGGWQARRLSAIDVDKAWLSAVNSAVSDIALIGDSRRGRALVVHGDSRKEIEKLSNIDYALFSPPYPNSFDYTDVYNIELWMLGYLTDSDSNRHLRKQTLRSHVQTSFDWSTGISSSQSLVEVLAKLQTADKLWDRRLPEMVAAYFDDMHKILCNLSAALRPGGHLTAVVGDSQYSGVLIRTDVIMAEIAAHLGYTLTHSEPVRVMRSSAQHGGAHELNETALTLRFG